MIGVFERFTPRARLVVALAEEDAGILGHSHVSTEHILLGLLREEQSLAARLLESLDITVERVRPRVAGIDDHGEGRVPYGPVPFTPRAGVVYALALREALSLGHNYIGAEEILLALVREDESAAARMLVDFDIDLEEIRNEVITRLSDAGPGLKREERWEGVLSEIRTALRPRRAVAPICNQRIGGAARPPSTGETAKTPFRPACHSYVRGSRSEDRPPAEADAEVRFDGEH